MAKNPANKLILPNETLSSLGSIAAIGDLLNKDSKKDNNIINKMTNKIVNKDNK